MVVQLASKRRLDANVLRAFLNAIGLYPVGTWLELADGRVGRVVRASGPESSRPLIAILDETGKEPDLVPLATTPELQIAKTDASPPVRRLLAGL